MQDPPYKAGEENNQVHQKSEKTIPDNYTGTGKRIGFCVRVCVVREFTHNLTIPHPCA